MHGGDADLFKYTDKLIEGPGGAEEDEFKPTCAEELFVTIEITGAECALASTDKVKGKYTAALPDGEVQLESHEIVFHSTGSSLAFGGKKASFTNTISGVMLKSAKLWYAD